MADDVKQLLVSVDASVALLRANLLKGDQVMATFERGTNATLERVDRRFAQVGKPLNNIGATVARTRAEVATIGTSVAAVEKRIVASSANIKSALLASTAGLAAAFSVNAVKEYADSYTRFTNQLKVAGVEGAALSRTQEDLFKIAQKYGVELESIGTLFGRATQAGDTLGASQKDILKFADGIGAALKIQGGAPEQTKGALLQLSQLLGTGTVRAEEFNSVNEGARPILMAVANGIDKYRGSVSALRADVLAGTVTSRDFFQGFLKGSADLEAKAAKSNMTIGASLQILNNALGKYIGQSDEGLSATSRFAAGVKGIADNLDTILPALTAVAIGFGATKAAGLGFDAVTAVLARVAQADAAVARQVLLGNASFIDRTAATARGAIAAEEAAVAEVAAIQATIAARQEEAVQLRANLALAAQQRAEAIVAQEASATAAAAGFGRLGQGGNTPKGSQAAAEVARKAEFATKRALAVADAELAIAENELAVAQTRSAVAARASTAATAAATVGARAAAAASALFSGALTLVAAALPIIAIGLLVAAIINIQRESNKAEADVKAFAEHTRQLDGDMRALNISANAAAGGVAAVGNQAVTSTGKMLAFAGAVGEAASKLYDLAKARRHEQVLSFTTQKVAADQDVANAEARIASRRYSTAAGATSNNPRADADDRRLIALARRNSTNAYRSAQQSAALPLESRLSESERNGGRDVKGEISRSRNDLKIAQAGGDKTEVNRLKAQVYELTQYQGYRKAGFSDESAKTQASSDASRLRSAGQGKIDAGTARAGAAADKKQEREAAAAARKQVAAVKDEANDTRAYRAAERQAKDQLAQSNADLTNSAPARAQIERDRITSDRDSRNGEIDNQVTAGRFGDPATAAARAKILQGLNDQAATAAIAVVDLHEKQRKDQDALALADRQSEIDRDQLTVRGQMATTVSQRREIELRLLAQAKIDEQRHIDAVLAPDSGASDGDRSRAQLDASTIDERYATKGAVTAQQNSGPLDQYRQQLHSATDDMKSSIESVEVDGLQGLESGLLGVVNGTETVGGAFKKMAASIISDLARIALQKGLLMLIPGGSLFGGLASGGKVEGRASGGRVSGNGRISGPGTGTSDDILAIVDGTKPLMLSDGESINTAASTKANWPMIDAMNKGKLRGLARGGRVGGGRPVFQPPVPNMRAIGESARAASVKREIVEVKVDKSGLFDVHVQRASAPLAQAAMIGGSNMALEDLSEQEFGRIP